MKKKVLIYPCGTEIGLEIYKAIKNSIHYEIFGGSCSYDHGRFAFSNHIDNMPFIRDSSIKDEIIEFNEMIKPYKFDFIYPVMDGIVTVFAKYRDSLDPIVIAPDYKTAMITRSKKKTYEIFSNLLPVPQVYESVADGDYPVFIKPVVGQGSSGTYLVNDKDELLRIKEDNDSQLILEYLPGNEYTIDCFTNAAGELIYCQGRGRNRIKNGISVNATLCDKDEFRKYANIINETLNQKGGWFFQLREDKKGDLKLLEIASRIAGASAIQRCVGANLPLLTVDVFNGVNVDDVAINEYSIELDRALENCYRVDLHYDVVYVDYDDTIVADGVVNVDVVAFLYQCINNHKKIILLSKHDGDLEAELKKHRLFALFDEIVHISPEDTKLMYIKNLNAIFIDDSYGERKTIHDKYHIPVFDISMLECLMDK